MEVGGAAPSDASGELVGAEALRCPPFGEWAIWGGEKIVKVRAENIVFCG